jgi:hypothetical protein
MTTKLTLTLQEDVIRSAKDYAEKTGSNLSDLVENYLKSLSFLAKNQDKKKTKYSPAVEELLGCVPAQKNYDYEKDLTEELTKKYLNL